jgi:hypothetical protein
LSIASVAGQGRGFYCRVFVLQVALTILNVSCSP